jgi:hypothetical protein
MTYQQACEVIAHVWRQRDGKHVEPEDIFNYSPTGELAMVSCWFDEADAWVRARG